MARRGVWLTPDDREPSVSVHFRLPAKQYDLTLKVASQRQMSLGDYLRHLIREGVTRSVTPPRK